MNEIPNISNNFNRGYNTYLDQFGNYVYYHGINCNYSTTKFCDKRKCNPESLNLLTNDISSDSKTFLGITLSGIGIILLIIIII